MTQGQSSESLTARGEAEQNRNDHKAAQRTFGEALDILAKNGGIPTARLLKGAGVERTGPGRPRPGPRIPAARRGRGREGGDRETASASAYLIGYVHRDLENYDLALRYFNTAYESGKALGNRRRVIMALNEIGNVHVFRNRFAEAMPFKETSLKLAREHGEPDLLANGLHDMGNFSCCRINRKRRLPPGEEALAIDRRIGQVRGTIISLYTIAECLQLLGRFPAALAALEEARPLAEKAGQKRDLSKILQLTSLTYEKTAGLPQGAGVSSPLPRPVGEACSTKRRPRQTTEMQTRFEVEKKQRENELLKQEKRIDALALAKGRNQRNFLFFVALLVLLLAGVLYRQYPHQGQGQPLAGGGQRPDRGAAGQAGEGVPPDGGTGPPRPADRPAQPPRRPGGDRARGKALPALAKAVHPGHGRPGRLQGRQRHRGPRRRGFRAARPRPLSSPARCAPRTWWPAGAATSSCCCSPETDAEGARIICAAIVEKIVGPRLFSFNGRRLKVAISMGTGTFRAGGTIEECLREADQAMYRSRRK